MNFTSLVVILENDFLGVDNMLNQNSKNEKITDTDLTKEQKLLILLDDLMALLKVNGYWETKQPTIEQLASQQPFAIDMLTFTQWLQFIFIVRMKRLIVMQQTLPTTMSIAPMASQVLPNEFALFKILSVIDSVISE
ncbi:YqcC family protein [Psychromonas sp. RZ22]|uniref:YqcC family protein n=1 Tax=Psychromonas algarum TaxID=2555643 RepID=UPI0010678522|nr:YqcC family protein [Psychromonas sp. RZ22]TEW54424.1 YqcC family protein [Psychromonas sp. RZ22]